MQNASVNLEPNLPPAIRLSVASLSVLHIKATYGPLLYFPYFVDNTKNYLYFRIQPYTYIYFFNMFATMIIDALQAILCVLYIIDHLPGPGNPPTVLGICDLSIATILLCFFLSLSLRVFLTAGHLLILKLLWEEVILPAAEMIPRPDGFLWFPPFFDLNFFLILFIVVLCCP